MAQMGMPWRSPQRLCKLQRHAAIGKRELVLENIALFFEQDLKFIHHFGTFGKQTFLDYFIDVCTGE